MGHIPVLLHEAIDGLNLSGGDIFVDGTLGNAGHSLEVFRRFGDSVRIIGIEANPEIATKTQEVLRQAGSKAEVVNENFRNIDVAVGKLGIKQVDAMLLDLGLNSDELELSGKGFSFQRDEPLLMTFGEPHEGVLTARDIVNNFDEVEIANSIFEFGEERYSRRIATAIVEARKKEKIETTKQLVNIVERALPRNYERGRIHPATRTFQALRIVVNDELGALTEVLTKGFSLLSTGGRIATISFNSLEDRIVKHLFREKSALEQANIITKKPLTPSNTELQTNKRSRSAKLRILEKN